MKDNCSSHSQVKNLQEWLSYIESIHSVEIDLGLDRIKQVAERLSLDLSFAKVITVAGTNGKGTTCAFIENALLDIGMDVAVYSSPHIEYFNERLRINQCDIDDDSLIQAFEQIESARNDISLSYYEFTTLAAFSILQKIQPSYIILEVGLGGRLDATNMIDTDIAVITTVDLDHQAFLGNTREAIAFEKAGIMRSNTVAVIGDIAPPNSLLEHGKNIQANMSIRSSNFKVEQGCEGWHWKNEHFEFTELNTTHIPQDNVATALEVLSQLSIDLDKGKINHWIAQTKVAGRTEFFNKPCHTVLDVGHNPQAARYLANNISQRGYDNIYAVVGMLVDKDIQGTLSPLNPIISGWFLADLSVYRGAEATDLASKLNSCCDEVKDIRTFSSVTNAYEQACQSAQKNDLILVFGSFYTVAEIRSLLIK